MYCQPEIMSKNKLSGPTREPHLLMGPPQLKSLITRNSDFIDEIHRLCPDMAQLVPYLTQQSPHGAGCGRWSQLCRPSRSSMINPWYKFQSSLHAYFPLVTPSSEIKLFSMSVSARLPAGSWHALLGPSTVSGAVWERNKYVSNAWINTRFTVMIC